MKTIYVPLDDHDIVDLDAIAREERRRPADQASVLLKAAIAKARTRSSSSAMNRLIRETSGRPQP